MALLRAEYRRRIRAARRLTAQQNKELRQAWFPEDFQRILAEVDILPALRRRRLLAAYCALMRRGGR
jgi:hypothetical protein